MFALQVPVSADCVTQCFIRHKRTEEVRGSNRTEVIFPFFSEIHLHTTAWPEAKGVEDFLPDLYNNDLYIYIYIYIYFGVHIHNWSYRVTCACSCFMETSEDRSEGQIRRLKFRILNYANSHPINCHMATRHLSYFW